MKGCPNCGFWTTGQKINYKASLRARLTEYRARIPELEKLSRKTPPKTLVAEKTRVEAAKAALPLLLNEIRALEEELETL